MTKSLLIAAAAALTLAACGEDASKKGPGSMSPSTSPSSSSSSPSTPPSGGATSPSSPSASPSSPDMKKDEKK